MQLILSELERPYRSFELGTLCTKRLFVNCATCRTRIDRDLLPEGR